MSDHVQVLINGKLSFDNQATGAPVPPDLPGPIITIPAPPAGGRDIPWARYLAEGFKDLTQVIIWKGLGGLSDAELEAAYQAGYTRPAPPDTGGGGGGGPGPLDLWAHGKYMFVDPLIVGSPVTSDPFKVPKDTDGVTVTVGSAPGEIEAAIVRDDGTRVFGFEQSGTWDAKVGTYRMVLNAVGATLNPQGRDRTRGTGQLYHG